MRRSTAIMTALATAGALTFLVGLGLTVAGPAPARDVAFIGGVEGSDARCHGPVLWTGEVAWAACDWSYDDRGLIELDPETARATVLHRWSLDDGNSPDLRIVRPCADGQLFVIGESRQTTLVTRRGAEVRASRIDLPGTAVLGASCGSDGDTVFVEEPGGYAIHRVAGEDRELRRTIRADEVPGRIVGAWFEDGAWHAVVHDTRSQALLAGPIGADLTRFGELPPGPSGCMIGAPGGWLGTGHGSACSHDAAIDRVDGAFRVVPIEASSALVVHAGPGGGYGLTLDKSDTKLFRGLGARDFELRQRGAVFEAQRGAVAPVAVAKASFSPLAIGAFALPLTDDRVAVWGGLGSQIVILGPDLRRVDEPGIPARIWRPFGRFKSSSMSIFDQVCYFVLLLAAPVWLVALAALGRSFAGRRRLVRAACVFVGLFVVGVWGCFRVFAWL